MCHGEWLRGSPRFGKGRAVLSCNSVRLTDLCEKRCQGQDRRRLSGPSLSHAAEPHGAGALTCQALPSTEAQQRLTLPLQNGNAQEDTATFVPLPMVNLAVSPPHWLLLLWFQVPGQGPLGFEGKPPSGLPVQEKLGHGEIYPLHASIARGTMAASLLGLMRTI